MFGTTTSKHPPTATETNGDVHNHELPGNVVTMELETTDKDHDAVTSLPSANECGCCGLAPACAQRLATPIFYLLSICGLFFIQSLLLSGYSSSIFTTIEKRYDLWSSEIGYIISSYDVTSVLTGILVSYYGDKHNRPLWLGRGALLIALGTLLFTVPHFFGREYIYSGNYSTNVSLMCPASGVYEFDSCHNDSSERWAMGVFIAAFMLIGIGSSPIYTLGPTYLYDNCWRSKYPVYSSVMYAMGALGPAMGFLMGAGILGIWVHPGNSPPPGSVAVADWVGAWWIGFLMISAVALLVSIPMLMFPRELPGLSSQTNTEARPVMAGYGAHLMEFPRILWSLVKNPVWLFISLSYVVEQFIGTGFNRFIVKYLEVTYGLDASNASIVTGFVLIPAATTGILCGGMIMRKWPLSSAGIAKYLLVLNVPAIASLVAMMLFTCDTVTLAGVNAPYSSEVNATSPYNITSECNLHCSCDVSVFQPVCGNDSITYYSACLAGCQSLSSLHSDAEYSNCTCISPSTSGPISSGPWEGSAVSGICSSESGCWPLAGLLVLLFIDVFVTTVGQNPVLLLTLRSVDSANRSFALGMQNFLIQVIAYIPAPIVFGKIFDSVCLKSTQLCDQEGACQLHDSGRLTLNFIGAALGLKGFTLIFLAITWFFASRASRKSFQYETQGSCDTNMTETSFTSSVSTISFARGAESSPPQQTTTELCHNRQI